MIKREDEFRHVPVMLEEVLDTLACKPGDIVVDATVGGAGHSLAIIERIIPGGILVGIDRDCVAINAANERLKDFADSFVLKHGNYVRIKEMLEELGIKVVDSVLMDLGVSSHQLDQSARGFSFRQDAPLDMRMDMSQKFSAHDLVNGYSECDLVRVIGEYGEERWAKRIAKFIIENRPVNTTGELDKLIRMAVPAKARRGETHPARRTFQGIRIEVNQEIALLEDALKNAVDVLKPGGRLCVITFHSLEDRIAKHTFRRLSGYCTCSPDKLVCECKAKAIVEVLTAKPVIPRLTEQNENPRSKSAKLRACYKL